MDGVFPPRVKVTRGSFTAIVPEWGAIALHDGCMLEESEDIRKAVSFQSVFKYATQGVLQIGGWITTQMVIVLHNASSTRILTF